MKRLLSAIGAAVLMAVPFSTPARGDSGPLVPKLVPLKWRTSVANVNANGFVDSAIFSRSAAWNTNILANSDTTAPFSLLDFVPDRLGLGLDSAAYITVAISPSNGSTLGAGSDSTHYGFQVSYNGKDWGSAITLLPIIDASTAANYSYRKINVPNASVATAAGTFNGINRWPLGRVIVSNDHNGEFGGAIFGYGAGNSNYKGKNIPIIWRTQTTVDDPNDRGYLDSAVVRMTGAANTETTAAISLLEFTTDYGGTGAHTTNDTTAFIQVAFYPTNSTQFTTVLTSATFGMQFSFNGKDWFNAVTASALGCDLFGNHLVRAFNVSRVTFGAAAGEYTFNNFPLMRLIVTGDWNGEVQASVTGYGPE